MAIRVCMISVVIPIRKIASCFDPGGFGEYCNQRKKSMGRSVWHDENLAANAHMDPEFLELDIDKWESLGLTPVEGERD